MYMYVCMYVCSNAVMYPNAGYMAAALRKKYTLKNNLILF